MAGGGLPDVFGAIGSGLQGLAGMAMGGGGGGGGGGSFDNSGVAGNDASVLDDPTVASQAAVSGSVFPEGQDPTQQQQQQQEQQQQPEQNLQAPVQQAPVTQPLPGEPPDTATNPGWIFNPAPTAKQEAPNFAAASNTTQQAAPQATAQPQAGAAPTQVASAVDAPVAPAPAEGEAPQASSTASPAPADKAGQGGGPLNKAASVLKNLAKSKSAGAAAPQLPSALTGGEASSAGQTPQSPQTPTAERGGGGGGGNQLMDLLFGGKNAFTQDLMGLTNQAGGNYGRREFSSQDFAGAPAYTAQQRSDMQKLAGGAAQQPPQQTAEQQPAPQQPPDAAGPISVSGASLQQPPKQQPDGTQVPTNGNPGGTVQNARAPSQGFGADPKTNANRPFFYKNKLDFNGKQFDFGSGGQQFASLPYGRYRVNPGAIGSIGQRIGAIAGISDSDDPNSNTVHDPRYRGSSGTSARAGVEIHPDTSGGALQTNGCIGIAKNQWGTFSSEFKQAAARGPLVLEVGPNGASLKSEGAPQMASATGQLPQQRQAPLATDGKPLTLGERNNNPGNIKQGPDAMRFGATGYDRQGHAIFPDYETGVKAQASLLQRRYNGMSIEQMAPIYAGKKYASEWMRGVTKFGGYSRYDVPDMSSPEGMQRLQEAIRKQEGVRSPAERQGRPPPTRFPAPDMRAEAQ